jgi:hypothetical protein
MQRMKVLLEIKEEAEAMINYHKAQTELYINQPLATTDHANQKTAIMHELDKMQRYVNCLDLLDTYFIK